MQSLTDISYICADCGYIDAMTATGQARPHIIRRAKAHEPQIVRDYDYGGATGCNNPELPDRGISHKVLVHKVVAVHIDQDECRSGGDKLAWQASSNDWMTGLWQKARDAIAHRDDMDYGMTQLAELTGARN